MNAHSHTKFASVCVALAAAVAWAAPARAAQAAPAPSGPATETDRAEAYHQFLVGSFLESEDDADAAIAAFRRALELDPSAAGVAAELADLYVRMNREDDAMGAAGQALTIDPENVSAHQTLGFIYAGRLDGNRNAPGRSAAVDDANAAQAIDHLEKAAQYAPAQADANVRATLARLYVRASDFDKAVPLLTTLVAQEPGWRDGPQLLLQAYVGAGRTNDAVAWLETHAPDDRSLYPTLGDFYDRAHRWQDAADAYAEAIKAAPRSVDLRTRYASSLMNAGGRDQLGQARDALNDALAIRANDANVLYLLAQTNRQLGDLGRLRSRGAPGDRAERRQPVGVLRAGRDARGARAVRRARGRAGAGRREHDRARRRGRARSRDAAAAPRLRVPGDGPVRRGDRHLRRGAGPRPRRPVARRLPRAGAISTPSSTRQAAAIAHEARAGRPDDLRLARLEAQALVRGGKTNQGVAVLQDLVDRNSDNPTSFIALADLYQDARRGADAVRVLRDAKTQFPTNTAVAFELGAVLERQKKYPRRRGGVPSTIELDPENAPALNYLGYMLADRGVRLEESVALLKRALALEPDNGAVSRQHRLGVLQGRQPAARRGQPAARRRAAADQLRHPGSSTVTCSPASSATPTRSTRGRARSQGDGESVDRGDIDKKIRSARQKIGNRR